MGRLVTGENSDHWYRKDGTPCFSVPYADKKRAGETRATTVTDARKLGLVPSVTTILGVLSKENLVNWQIEQAIHAALTLPRLPNEMENDFAKRVVKDMDAQRDASAEKGKEIEEACRLWSIGELYPEQMEKFVEGFRKCMDLLKAKVVWMQKPFAARDYGGTRDMLISIENRRLVLVDLKTQDGKIDNKTGLRRPYNYYDTWCAQLEGYVRETPEADGTMNIIVDRNFAGDFDFHEWTKDERAMAWENFQAAKVVFQNRKKYWPAGREAVWAA